ncbi:MAG TPA: hypothetical protein VIR60_06340 [Gammaproteobacteria bacterium]
MDTQTLVALVGVGGALLGSAIGGFTSYLSTRSVRRLEWKLSFVENEIHSRESLYADFLTEANRLVLHQVEGKLHRATEMTTLFALEARIWFFSDSVGKAARDLALYVLNDNIKDKEAEAGEEKKSYSTLRDSYITECKKNISDMKCNV